MKINPASPKLRSLKDDYEVTFVPMEALHEYGGLNVDRIKRKIDGSVGYTEFQEDDVVFAKITPCFENGKGSIASGLTNGVAYGTTELHVLRVSKCLDNRFLFYITVSDVFRQLGESEMYGAGGQKRVPPEFCKDFSVTYPPLSEQTAIADFLDRETGRIDALIAKKRRMIELLREKRSALISRTVTRGLPLDVAREFNLEPHTRFKDSGIEWLGEVPEGWEVIKVQYFSRFKGGSTPLTTEDRYWENGTIPWVSPKDMKSTRVTDTIDHLTSEGMVECASGLLDSGHVLIVVRSGILRHTLPVAINDCPVALNQDMRAFVLNRNKIFPEYLMRLIEGNQKAVLEEWRKAGTTVESIEMGYVLGSSLPVPPLPEQTAIATYLDRETANIDKLSGKFEQAIERLQEYRTALITAAVTGKIDVRYAAESRGACRMAAEEGERYG
ncbi:hypothetical protein B9H02_05105 [Prosthecochloris sp. HL-130-GSB]|nr:hypothetical protein B9H02_05105 [Prosthecochloris sp. HL-130-GSB]